MIHKDYTDYLRDALDAIRREEERDNYAMRARHIYQAMVYATDLSYDCGFRPDPEEPGWMVAYIELPTGQISWHVKQHANAWDRHTTSEKWDRVGRFMIGKMYKRH